MNDLTRRSALKAALGLPVLPFVGRPEPTGQPMPVAVHVSHSIGPFYTTTAIARVWEPGAAARCTLCPADRCGAYGDVCLVTVPRHVTFEDAALFDATGLRWGDRPPTP